jgi:hypothetical protein
VGEAHPGREAPLAGGGHFLGKHGGEELEMGVLVASGGVGQGGEHVGAAGAA